MGTTNYGDQVKSIGFHSPADSSVVNKRNVSVQERGIYSGGYLTMTTGNNVSLSPLVCVIGDNNYQLRVETTTTNLVNAITLTDVTNKYVVLRWAYSGVTGQDYMDVLAVAAASILPNDLLVGIGVFDGFGVLTGIEYADATGTYVRSEAMSSSRILKVIPTETPSKLVRINQGYINYGTAKKFVPTQTYDLTATIAGIVTSKIIVLYVDENGAIQKYSTGTDSATPTVPEYNNKIVLAEITLTAGMTQITTAKIRDTRLLVGAGINASTLFPSMTGNALKHLRVNVTETGVEYVDMTATTKRILVWGAGYPAVGTKVSATYTLPWAGTITKAYANVVTAPSGAAILIDINRNGTTIWSTQSNRLTIADGATSGTQTSFNTTAVFENDVITMDIDQIGSSASGVRLTVELVIIT
jgi:hypothetical protein